MLLFEKRMECLDVLFAIQNWLRHRHEPGAVSLFLKAFEAPTCAGINPVSKSRLQNSCLFVYK